MIAFPIFTAGIQASSLINKLSIRLNPVGILALGGNYNDTEKLKDIINTGLGVSTGFRYEVSENFYIDFGYTYNWMSVKEEKRPFDYRHTSSFFNLSSFTLNVALFLKSGYKIEPYVTLGCGIYPWKFSEDAFGGKAWPAPGRPQDRFSNSSFGLNSGLGIEVFVWTHLSIITEVRYTYIFSKDIVKFRTDDFTQQDFLGVYLGIIYYFGKE
jgi:opacity protein-like surface antigen